jgi:hypothetical protein
MNVSREKAAENAKLDVAFKFLITYSCCLFILCVEILTTGGDESRKIFCMQCNSKKFSQCRLPHPSTDDEIFHLYLMCQGRFN